MAPGLEPFAQPVQHHEGLSQRLGGAARLGHGEEEGRLRVQPGPATLRSRVRPGCRAGSAVPDPPARPAPAGSALQGWSHLCPARQWRYLAADPVRDRHQGFQIVAPTRQSEAGEFARCQIGPNPRHCRGSVHQQLCVCAGIEAAFAHGRLQGRLDEMLEGKGHGDAHRLIGPMRTELEIDSAMCNHRFPCNAKHTTYRPWNRFSPSVSGCVRSPSC